MLKNEKRAGRFFWCLFFVIVSINFLITRSASAAAYTTIVATNSGRCLDVPASTMQAGVQIIQYACHGQANQLWRLEPFRGAYRIVSASSRQCLNVRGSDMQAGAAVIQWPCEGGSLNERWYLSPGRYGTRLIAAHSRLCLNVAGGSMRDEAVLIQWPCSGQRNEMFVVEGVRVLPPVVVRPVPLPPPPPPVYVRPIEVVPEPGHSRWHHWHERDWHHSQYP